MVHHIICTNCKHILDKHTWELEKAPQCPQCGGYRWNEKYTGYRVF